MFRLLIAGGGTGGHLYPGIAVAREVIGRGGEAMFIGTEKGIEAKVLPREGLRFTAIRAGRFKGAGVIDRVRTALTIPIGVAQSMTVIKGFRPDAVLGVGGYASFPAVVAARLIGVPSVIQEQNAFPGLANRLLGRVVDVCALGFREAERLFPKGKAVFTGNPIRAELALADRAEALSSFGMEEGLITVLIFGGSAGAHRINQAVVDALPYIAGLKGKAQFIHQTGEKDARMVEAAYMGSGFRAAVLPFINDMAGAYACADLAVCRSGALTLAELAALGKPALLIPYPFAANDHQLLNARSIEESGAARVLLDQDATGGRLAEELTAMLGDKDALAAMAVNSKRLGRPEAAAKVLDICIKLAGAKTDV